VKAAVIIKRAARNPLRGSAKVVIWEHSPQLPEALGAALGDFYDFPIKTTLGIYGLKFLLQNIF